MTSILTNPAAMAALQTLRMIDKNLEVTQGRVSSGYRVETAADNAAYWSISTTMRSDNKALSSVQDALGLGAAKVDTAYAALENAITAVDEIKKKLVAAYGVDADRPKIQEEISQLQKQLRSIAESASFSGENWLQAEVSDGGSPAIEAAITKSVVASFVRDSTGAISVATVDYSLNSGTVLFDLKGGNIGILDKEATFVKSDEAVVTQTETVAGPPAVTHKTDYILPLVTADEIVASGYTSAGTGLMTNAAGTAGFMKISGDNWVRITSTATSVSGGTVQAVANTASPAATWYYDIGSGQTYESRSLDFSVATLDITNLDDVAAMMGSTYTAEDVLDVMVSFVSKQLEAMTSAASALGSLQSRIEMQENFVVTLMDVIDKGIGRLVDADMNEESTRLKALQTQQQLGIQSLSIANSNAENILSLFR